MPVPTELPLYVVAAVLGAAVVHAGWNAAAKAIGHRLVASALMGAGYLVFGGLWCVVAVGPARASWPYLATSVVLQTGYLLLLTAAYAHGEFRRVYPLARGVAPVLVTVVAIWVLGERLAVWQVVGIAVLIGGLAVLAALPAGRAPHRFARGGKGAATGGAAAEAGRAPRRFARGGKGSVLAVGTGVVIAAYSLVDGLGVRQSGSAAGYAAWLMMLQGPLLIGVCAALAGPATLMVSVRAGGARVVGLGLVGGLASIVAYAIVLWAQDRASLAVVSALRETSVLFAGLIGALLFAEKFSPRQMVAAVGVVAGIALIQLG